MGGGEEDCAKVLEINVQESFVLILSQIKDKNPTTSHSTLVSTPLSSRKPKRKPATKKSSLRRSREVEDVANLTHQVTFNPVTESLTTPPNRTDTYVRSLSIGQDTEPSTSTYIRSPPIGQISKSVQTSTESESIFRTPSNVTTAIVSDIERRSSFEQVHL